MQCTTSTTTTTSLSTLFIVNIQSLMRKFYYFHFSNSSEQKIILLYDYHWGNPKPWSYCAFIFQYLHKSEERSRLTLEIHLQGNIWSSVFDVDLIKLKLRLKSRNISSRVKPLAGRSEPEKPKQWSKQFWSPELRMSNLEPGHSEFHWPRLEDGRWPDWESSLDN